MKYFRPILLLPAALAFALLAMVLNLADVLNLPNDVDLLVKGILSIAGVVWAWLSTPPKWATVAALCCMVLVHFVCWLGSERLIRASRFLFRKDYRIAQFKSIADDRTIAAFRVAAFAKRLLEETNWEPSPPPNLPSATSTQDYVGRANPGDYMQALVGLDIGRQSRVGGVFEEIAMKLGPYSSEPTVQALLNEKCPRFIQRVANAKRLAYENEAGWADVEKGRVFYSEGDRRRWHEIRYERQADNVAMAELHQELRDLTSIWKVTPDAETVRQLLAGIKAEIVPGSS